MNKFVKRVLVFISLLVILSITFVPSFAAVANGSEEFKVYNDLFSAVIPKGYSLLYSEDVYRFICEKNNDTCYITFSVFQNADSFDAASLSGFELAEFAENVASVLKESAHCDYDYVSSESGVDINGVKSVKLTYKYDDYDDEKYNAVMYMVSGKASFSCISFFSFGDFPAEDVNAVLNSYAANDELFNGQSFTNKVDFTGAPSYEEALLADVNDTDEWLYGTDDDFDMYDYDIDMTDEELMGMTYNVMLVACIIFAVPTIAVFAVAVVFIVKYVKNKKKLKDYQSKYGIL